MFALIFNCANDIKLTDNKLFVFLKYDITFISIKLFLSSVSRILEEKKNLILPQ